MVAGLSSTTAGWTVFESVELGSELLTFAGGVAYEARSPLRVLGKQSGVLNRPGFDAYLLRWEGASHAKQVRPGDPGQSSPSGA